MCKQCFSGRIALFQIAVGEIGMDGFITDRMDRLLLAPTSCFGDGVMPNGHLAYRAVAQPTSQGWRNLRLRFIIPVALFSGQLRKTDAVGAKFVAIRVAEISAVKGL